MMYRRFVGWDEVGDTAHNDIVTSMSRSESNPKPYQFLIDVKMRL